MRQDQYEKLQALAEKLADRFLVEADPENWTAAGEGDKLPRDMTSQERGDAYWNKKNAMATGGVLRYTLDLAGASPVGGEADAARDADMDRRIADAEKRAAAAVSRVLDKAKKRTFDERTQGKR
jgi:hypothetical protein